MSEPVSNSHVEDVLASIRKLVSQDDRPVREAERDRPTALQRKAEADAGSDEKFVLTSSFRVQDADNLEAMAQDAASEAPGDIADEADAALDRELSPSDPLHVDVDAAETGAVVGFNEDYEPADLDLGTNMDVADAPADFDAFEQVVVGLKTPDHLRDKTEEVPEDAATDAVASDADPLDEHDQTNVDTHIAFEHRPWRDLHDRDRAQEFAESGADTASESDTIADEPTSDHAETQSTVTTLNLVNPTRLPEEDLAPEPEIAPNSLNAKIAALEAVINKGATPQTEDEPAVLQSDPQDVLDEDVPQVAAEHIVDDLNEPSGEEVLAQTRAVAEEQTPPMSDDPELVGEHTNDTADAEQDNPEQDDAEQDDVAAQAGDLLVDEEMLRDLVSEIVQEQLQGVLGERITRNVRKLVRREIHRALATQELD